MALGRDAGAMAGRLERLAPPPGGAARSIYMVALGDSVLWGQGLREEQKFQTKLEKWIAANNPDRRPVHRWNFAHSGATIGSLRGLPSAYSGAGQMTAAVFGRLASANRPGRGMEDIPDFDPRMVRRAGGDSTDAAPPRPTGTRSDRKPIEPPAADRLGGEIPRTSPTLWRQLDLALETMRTGKDPRFDYGASPRIDPAEVDLVLLDGGANDVDFLGTILNTLRNRQTTYDYVHGIVYPRMKEYLPHVLRAFPSATVLMNTYYRGISWQSGPAVVAALVQFALAGGIARALLPALTGGAVASDQVQATIDRMDGFESAIKDAYTRVVAEQQQDAQRIRIVSPDFAPENAYGASRSFLFHIEEADPAENTRIRECDALLGQWFQDVGQTFVEGASHSNPVDTPLWVVCRDANTFHPNVAGANRYFERMRDSLQQAPPPFMRQSPQLRVVVNGTTTGDSKTVTVTALDPNTNQPVNATVRIAGVSGATGQALTFPAGCTAATDGGATEVVETPVGPGGRATRVAPRRPATRPPTASVTCSGTVSAPGYRDATFRY
jgi:hypothetical protein